jgi:hypothetical protein
MAYEMMSEPPTPGTLMESLMLLVWRMRQDVELQRTRALANAIIVSSQQGDSNDKILRESWTAYRDALLPYQKVMTETQDQKAMDFLKREVARGPIKVQPLQSLSQGTFRRRRRQGK